jgi:hypothetical protein
MRSTPGGAHPSGAPFQRVTVHPMDISCLQNIRLSWAQCYKTFFTLSVVMLRIFMLRVIVLIVVMLCVIILRVVMLSINMKCPNAECL